MINSKGGAKLLSNSIKQRLKILETLQEKSNRQYLLVPNIKFMTEPNGDVFKIVPNDTYKLNNMEMFKNIKDVDKLEFKTEQECQEWIDANKDLIDLPEFYNDKYKNKIFAQCIKVVDNSYLEHFMYEYNRQSKGG